MSRFSHALLLLMMMAGAAMAHSNRVVSDMIHTDCALEMFRRNAGRLPTEAEGLAALVEKPATYPESKRWTQIMLKVPLDPWNRLYQYVVSAEHKDGYGLYSFGPDGVSSSGGNDPDDWNSWAEDFRGKKTFADHVRSVPAPVYVAGGILAWVLTMALRRYHGKPRLPDP